MPVRFGEDANQFSLRKRKDGQVVAEFQHQVSMEKITLSTLQLLELEILAQYALHRAFERPEERYWCFHDAVERLMVEMEIVEWNEGMWERK